VELAGLIALVLALLEGAVLVLVLREIAILRVAGGRRSGLRFDQPLPPFSARTLAGGQLAVDTLRRTLLLFVSSDCALCRTLVDELNRLPREALPPMVVGLTSHSDIDLTHPFIQSLGFASPESILLDDRRALFARVDAPVTPWAYVISADGRVRGSGVPRSAQELRDMAKAA
jgi:hypothetical protein